jgi:hypothetical protein
MHAPVMLFFLEFPSVSTCSTLHLSLPHDQLLLKDLALPWVIKVCAIVCDCLLGISTQLPCEQMDKSPMFFFLELPTLTYPTLHPLSSTTPASANGGYGTVLGYGGTCSCVRLCLLCIPPHSFL